MKIAPPTSDEQARLKALYAYDVLDTEAEKVYDDLTLLASQICGTPIALISLVDPDRQWFKSAVGIDAKETSRDMAFCAHTIHQRDIFEVPDTLMDERFVDNPLVTSEPNIRFYAGTQLVTPEGYAIGTLCAIDDKPNNLSAQQRNSLEVLGRSVISQLELRKKIKELKAASQHKTEFLSTMSHELRTPLNAMISFSRLMQDEVKYLEVTAKFNKYLNHLDYSGKRLLDVINSVLDLSKIEEGKMQLDIVRVHCPSFFQKIVDMLMVSADEKDLSLSLSVEPSVPEHLDFDETKLGQILLNLISNAIKFSPKGTQVDVNIFATNKELSLVVKDQGVGISQADQLKLFNKFQQVGKEKSSKGTGLGLSITKGLVQLMDGEIKLSSAQDHGSIFKVVLPIMAGMTGRGIHLAKSLTLNCRKDSKILAVEDNVINQEVVKALFSSLGLKIQIAESGERALQMVEKSTYQLIFMDIHLPGISGIETSVKIKQKWPDLPIIGLSADAFAQQNFLQNKNIDNHNTLSDYLLKPIEIEQIIRVLNHYLPTDNVSEPD
ncbi:MAG: signal transduction histidine kinase/ActR/RegA family two-component response regulator [Paraglaciecola sp.]|jgi:signal transduction histidine kinase/ActR/RegA family two-component response regulator